MQENTNLKKNCYSFIKNLINSGLKDIHKPFSNNIPGLDLLRSIAILLVVSGHYFGDYSTQIKLNVDYSKFPLFFFGWIGVDCFFVLSGFLIGKQLWKELRDEGTINIPNFIVRRGLRIWPYYYAFVMYTVFTSTTPLSSFIPDIFFFSNYTHNHIAGGWSLSTEEQFYIIMPILLLFSAKFVPLRHGYLIPGILFILLPIGRYLIFASYPGMITEVIRSKLTYTYIHTHSDGLIAGILVSWAYINKRQFFQKMALKKNIILPFILIVCGLILRFASNHIFAFTSLGLIFGGILIFMLRDSSRLSNFFSWRGFYVLSKLSYGMYLNHFPVLWLVLPIILTFSFAHSQVGFWIAYLIIFSISITIAYLTFIIIESPFLQLRKYLLKEE